MSSSFSIEAATVWPYKYTSSWVSLVLLSSFNFLSIRLSMDKCFFSRVEFLAPFGFSLWSANFR